MKVKDATIGQITDSVLLSIGCGFFSDSIIDDILNEKESEDLRKISYICERRPDAGVDIKWFYDGEWLRTSLLEPEEDIPVDSFSEDECYLQGRKVTHREFFNNI